MNATVTAFPPSAIALRSDAAGSHGIASQGVPGAAGVWFRDVASDPVRLAALLSKLAEAEETITQQQERIAYLESLTMTDELTGLVNRRGFNLHLKRELAAARRAGQGGGVLVMIDLDGFKAINDTHGHLAGDSYLRQVARLLQAHVRQHDVVARLGGDEFAVLLTDTDPATGAARAAELAQLANRAHAAWNGQELPVRFSVGVQPYGPADHEDEVIRRADAKMYRHKGSKIRRDRKPKRAKAVRHAA
ncbi:GGDEF domain-containing protein [Azospirillum sp.]|uniref:GGDEF domain-containing protein n=1 Tax=Azospirillum sp. TaxID=34012 RepID=UPI003D7291B5